MAWSEYNDSEREQIISGRSIKKERQLVDVKRPLSWNLSGRGKDLN